MKNIDWDFLKKDMTFIILNCLVNRIPCWRIRKKFYEGFGMKIGKGARIGLYTIIIAPQKIELGERSIINHSCFVDGSGKVIIENDVSISCFAKIISCTHSTRSEIFEYKTNPIWIKNNVWIAKEAIILDNSIIEEKAIIGSGSIFKGKAESNCIYYGNPSKKIKDRQLNKNYRIDFNPYFR